MNKKTEDLNKKNQIILIICALVMMLVYVLGVALSWDQSFWKRDDYVGNIFGPAKDSIKYAFSSWTNAIFALIIPLILASIHISLLIGLCSKKKIKIYYTPICLMASLPLTASIVMYIVMFVNCTPTIALIYNLCFGASMVNFPAFLSVMLSTCEKCYHYQTKELLSTTKKKSYSTNYVPGGYRTVKADVKDNSGNVIGTIETQRYEKGHSYTSSSTTTTRKYKCTVCGNVTESTSSS